MRTPTVWASLIPKNRAPVKTASAMDENKERMGRESLEFIFNSHLSLFNTRRDHEWRVINSAMVLMGAVDTTILVQGFRLSSGEEVLWWLSLCLLFLSIAWYQWGVQVRNRVDRVAMDRVLTEICDRIKIPDCPIRAGIDREREDILGSQTDYILHHTYLWAFFPQMLVLFTATIFSAYIPYLQESLRELHASDLRHQQRASQVHFDQITVNRKPFSDTTHRAAPLDSSRAGVVFSRAGL